MQEEQPKKTLNAANSSVSKTTFERNNAPIIKDNYGSVIINYNRENLRDNNVQSDFTCSGESPYQGLSPFLEADAALFFGRDEKVEFLCSLVQSNPLTAVIGASGSGKSSLVYAGLLPRLRQKGWLIGSFRPKLQPFAELATTLINLLEPESDSVNAIEQASTLTKTLQEENGFYQAISRLLKKYPSQKFILFADQFEELFEVRETERRAFIDSVLNTLDKTPELKLVLTLRADFCEQAYADSLLLNKLQKTESGVLQATDLKLGLMSELELQEVIESPVKGKAIFQPGLVKQILEDLGTVSSNLPLLEVALDELWKQGRLTLDAYRAIGGVREALANRANETYKEYEKEGKGKQVEKLFRQLVAVSEDTADTRRIIAQSQIKDWNLVEELAAKRFLVIGQGEKSKEQTVELIHEALIQGWEMLRGWVNDKREDSIKFQRIESAAKEWRRSKNLVSDLWQGQRLKNAVELLTNQDKVEPLSPLAQEFIQKSRTAARNKLFRNYLTGVAAFSLVSCVIGYFSLQDYNRKLKQSALRGETNPEILKAIPDWLREAESKQKEGKDVEAIAIARENVRIMENWRNAIVTNPGQYDRSSIQAFSGQAENRQVSLIQQYRLPKLEKELKNGKIGQLLPSADLSTDCEQMYIVGALRTTCEIIFRDLGAAADPLVSSQEKVGFTPNIINTQEKADRMPCRTLVQIEKLWRENTKNKSCGWLGSQEDGLAEPGCKELDGQSLADKIFAAPVNVAIDYLKQCSIPQDERFKKPSPFSKTVKPAGHK